MAAVVRRIISKYDVLRTARPMVVDSLTAGTLFMSGDLLCQAIEKKKGEPYDWMRTARMTVFGVGVMGPAAYYWYHLIDRVFPSRDYSVVLRKVFLDQAVFSPPYYSTFFFIMPLLEGKSVDDAVANVKKSFVTTYVADCMLWPPVQNASSAAWTPTKYDIKDIPIDMKSCKKKTCGDIRELHTVSEAPAFHALKVVRHPASPVVKPRCRDERREDLNKLVFIVTMKPIHQHPSRRGAAALNARRENNEARVEFYTLPLPQLHSPPPSSSVPATAGASTYAPLLSLLSSLGLGEYNDLFIRECIDLDEARHLTDAQLKELGLPLGVRNKLLRAFASSSAALSSPSPAPASLPPYVSAAARKGQAEKIKREDGDGGREAPPDPFL